MQLPFFVSFFKVEKDPYLAAFNTDMRFTQVLNKGPRGEDIEGVIRSRRQAEFVDLEKELDLLAEKMENKSVLLKKQTQRLWKIWPLHSLQKVFLLRKPMGKVKRQRRHRGG